MQTILDLSIFEASEEAMFEEEANAFWRRLGVAEKVLTMPIPMVSKAFWATRLFLLEQKGTDIVITGAEAPVLCGLCGGFPEKAWAFTEAIAEEALRQSARTGQRILCFQELPFFDGGNWRLRPVSDRTRRQAARTLYKTYWTAAPETQREYWRHLSAEIPKGMSLYNIYNIKTAESFNALGYFCGLNLETVLCEELTELYDLSARPRRRPDGSRQTGRTDNPFPQLKRSAGYGK